MAGVRDRVAIVTGAGNGLGREIAQLLAQQGAHVVLGDLDAAGLEKTTAAITAAGGTAVALAGDLTEEAPAQQLIDAAVKRHGRIEILVNVVGGSRNAKIWDMRADDWDFVLRLNLRPTFLCTRAAVPHMIRQKYGRIVCMSSGAARAPRGPRTIRAAPHIQRPRPACTASCATSLWSSPSTPST
jgi:3-oxoacyl-[acyl-carrier protein] reductase